MDIVARQPPFSGLPLEMLSRLRHVRQRRSQQSKKLVCHSRVLHGYLRDTELEDVRNDAVPVKNSEGNVASNQLRWTAAGADGYVDREVDDARAANTRVCSAGIRPLDDMRYRRLKPST